MMEHFENTKKQPAKATEELHLMFAGFLVWLIIISIIRLIISIIMFLTIAADIYLKNSTTPYHITYTLILLLCIASIIFAHK